MQSLLELIEYLPPEVEVVVAVPYDPRQYRRVPERVHLEFVQPPKAWGGHGYVRLMTQQMGWYKAIHRLLRGHPVDLVHINSGPFVCLGGALAAKQRRLHVLEHARGFVKSSRYVGKIATRFTDYYVAISWAVAKSLVAHNVRQELCHVVYDPVVASSKAISVRECIDSAARLGMLGMLQPWKGQHVFLRALHMLHQRGVHFRAVVAGKEPYGSFGYEQYLRNLAQQYGISSMVEFCGFVPEPYTLLRNWDIAVHASIEPEPLGRVVIEAMLAGTPVVATNGGGVPEFVEHERTGLLVPMGDAGALADAIERLLHDTCLRRRLAESGYQREREMFDPQKCAREVMEVYKRLLE